MASPDELIALAEGRLAPSTRDRLLFSFDDGYADDFEVAEFLASRGIRAMFFVMPSFVGRSIDEFCDFHRRNGVEACRFFPRPCQGLERDQIREMAAMGHRIGGHNDSHRDLGRLHSEKDVRYEIQRALDGIGEILGQPCEDFAWGFGGLANMSPEAVAYLVERCPRIYSAVRGLNIPGRSPRFILRDDVKQEEHPFRYTQVALRGGMDASSVPEWTALERLGGRCPPYGAGSAGGT